jgi:hypothetical protein
VAVPIDALPDDPEALRALVILLATERDAALAESQRVNEQNDQLRHLLRQLQRNQFGRRSERLARSGHDLLVSLSRRTRHRTANAPYFGARHDVAQRGSHQITQHGPEPLSPPRLELQNVSPQPSRPAVDFHAAISISSSVRNHWLRTFLTRARMG